MPAPANSSLDLLLADAYDLRPILDHGLPEAAAINAPKPTRVRGADRVLRRGSFDKDPTDLSVQRWGVIVPEGRHGDQKLEAIAPLVQLREEEQGDRAIIYRVPSGLSAKDTLQWKYDVLDGDDVTESDRPQYLLILGDLDQISLEFQQIIANESFVGRLHFPHLDGYDSYARKVVRWAKKTTPEGPSDAFFFVAGNGSSAMAASRHRTIDPGLEIAQRSIQRQRFPVNRSLLLQGTLDDVRQSTSPSVLLSVAHGLGSPRQGWKSIAEQRALQGSLLLGNNEVLTAEHVHDTPFLAGGFWVNLASFGVGVSAHSNYLRWLLQLAEANEYRELIAPALNSLPNEDAPPFLTALPQAALANPEGPLAVLGQVDLAWTYSTHTQPETNSKVARLISSMQVMVRGGRAGPAAMELWRHYREVQDALFAGYEMEEDARISQRPTPPFDPVQRAQLWLLRNDLRTFLLLGDPAVRLPLRDDQVRASPKTTPSIPQTTKNTSTGSSGLTAERIEQIVLASIRGENPLQVHAAQPETTRAEIDRWIEAYKTAGRAAVAQFAQPNPKKD